MGIDFSPIEKSSSAAMDRIVYKCHIFIAYVKAQELNYLQLNTLETLASPDQN